MIYKRNLPPKLGGASIRGDTSNRGNTVIQNTDQHPLLYTPSSYINTRLNLECKKQVSFYPQILALFQNKNLLF